MNLLKQNWNLNRGIYYKKLLITLLILTSNVFAVGTQIKKDYLGNG